MVEAYEFLIVVKLENVVSEDFAYVILVIKISVDDEIIDEFERGIIVFAKKES